MLVDNLEPEAAMNSDIFIVSIRNILLFQMIVMTLYLGKALSGGLEFLSVWRFLRKPFLPNTVKEAEKGKNRFWEIDMTKFEP
jgi:hypothetical protein